MANGVPTEWFDLQVKHGNYLPLEKEDTLQEVQKQHQTKQEEKNSTPNMIDSKQTKQDLDELQDQFDMDDQFTKAYMAKRMQEIKYNAQTCKYGKLKQISRADYLREVTQEDPDSFVVLHLYCTSNQFCNLINKVLPSIADRYNQVKFVTIEGSKCIDNYPDKNCPTFIIYKAGKPVSHLLSVDRIMKGDVNNLENLLESQGVIKIQHS